ncbi:Ig-like domain-containing protein, partial [Bacillus cereus]|uniref:Ig-like domain-containing protein n=1 Tax=Bacillus cereus TaxID=1396 RepID=UPI00159192AB
MANVEVNEGSALPALPATVEVTLTNGEKAQKAVVWNTSAVDTSKPATYEVTGVVADTDLTAKVSVVVKAVAP